MAPRVPTRDRILLAAQRLQQRQGLPALSIRRVAALVGLSPMAIYRHFPSKDALVEAIVHAGFARFEQRMAAAMREPDAALRLRAGLVAYVQFAIDEPRTFELLFLTPLPFIPLAPASIRTTTSPAFGALLDTVRAGVASGAMHAADPVELVLLGWATMHGLAALHHTGRFGHDDALFATVADRAISSLLTSLLVR